jgi:hypothetical protein
MSALTDCSIMLYVMTERWPAARKYRDMFESIKQCVLAMTASEAVAPRVAVVAMNDDLRGNILSSGAAMTSENRDDLEQMLADMTGQPLFSWPNIGGEAEDIDIGSFPNDLEMDNFLSDGTTWEAAELDQFGATPSAVPCSV